MGTSWDSSGLLFHLRLLRHRRWVPYGGCQRCRLHRRRLFCGSVTHFPPHNLARQPCRRSDQPAITWVDAALALSCTRRAALMESSASSATSASPVRRSDAARRSLRRDARRGTKVSHRRRVFGDMSFLADLMESFSAGTRLVFAAVVAKSCTTAGA